MIALVDVGRASARIGLLRQQGTEWFVVDEKTAFPALKQALAHWPGHLTHVAALRYAVDVSTDLRPSWSGVRQATTITNALAFAWGVPAVDVLAGGSDEATIIKAAVAACHAAGAATHQAASDYDGLPNITQPKP